jgi:Chaperone of endosialidase
MKDASETLYLLKPVTYRYKKEIDVTQSLDYGLVAEEVATVDPNLMARDKDGQIETVRYTAVNAMLLNEFLKAHGKLQEQEATITRLTSTDAKQEATIANQAN